MKNKKVLFLIFLSYSMLITSAAFAATSVPIENLIVNLNEKNDIAINNAISTLKSELENVKVVNYNSFEDILAGLRTVVNLIYLGHGDSNGLKVGNQILTWKQASQLTNRYHVVNKVDFLNCNSANLIPFKSTNQKIGMTFVGSVDSVVGALVISTILNIRLGKISQSISIFNKAFNRDQAVMKGKILPHLLYLGPNERKTSVILFVFFALLTLLGAYVSTGALSGFFTLHVQFAIETFLYVLRTYLLANNFIKAATTLLDGLKVAKEHGLIDYLRNHLSFGDAVKIIGGIVAITALAIISEGASEVVAVVASAASMLSWLGKWANDNVDCDDVYGSSPGCSSSSSSRYY